mmetsp:Transcript_15520/g.33466  ORF Transcript_15520/g.33466 Transcript_15520/m.33466 type:complete len:319 (-) Transcript_15520:96-1052(-)
MVALKGVVLSLAVATSFDNAVSSPAGVCLSTRFQTSPLAPSAAVGALEMNGSIPQALDVTTAIKNVKLFDVDDGLLKALNKSDTYTVQLEVTNAQLDSISVAVSQINKAIQSYSNLHFEILVGNEPYREKVNPTSLNTALVHVLNNIPNVRVSVPFQMSIFATTYPTSSSTFSPEFINAGFMDVVSTLYKYSPRTFFSINAYPFFVAGQQRVTLEQITSKDMTVLKNMIQATNVALGKYNNKTTLDLTLGETGWPSDGNQYANSTLAQAYFQNAYQYLVSQNQVRSWFLFEAFDENNKPGANTEKYFGILKQDGQKKW